jgi:hypothetical protein
MGWYTNNLKVSLSPWRKGDDGCLVIDPNVIGMNVRHGQLNNDRRNEDDHGWERRERTAFHRIGETPRHPTQCITEP